MAHLLNVENVTVSLAARTLLDAVSLGVDDGNRIGVVGRNGDGKSTLLRVLTKGQQPDSGRVTHARDLRVGYLTQVEDSVRGSVLEYVVGPELLAAGEHTWAGEPKVRGVLNGLLGDIERDVPGGLQADVSTLSGGQRRRAALASVLMGEHDLLVLDEPTNHLDVQAVAWLASKGVPDTLPVVEWKPGDSSSGRITGSLSWESSTLTGMAVRPYRCNAASIAGSGLVLSAFRVATPFSFIRAMTSLV